MCRRLRAKRSVELVSTPRSAVQDAEYQYKVVVSDSRGQIDGIVVLLDLSYRHPLSVTVERRMSGIAVSRRTVALAVSAEKGEGVATPSAISLVADTVTGGSTST
jgi:hypothetical protein